MILNWHITKPFYCRFYLPLILNYRQYWLALLQSFLFEYQIFQKPISYDSDFFDLGRDSIGIALVKMKIKKRLDIDIPIEKLFDHPELPSLILMLDNPKDFVSKKLGLVKTDLREEYPL